MMESTQEYAIPIEKKTIDNNWEDIRKTIDKSANEDVDDDSKYQFVYFIHFFFVLILDEKKFESKPHQ